MYTYRSVSLALVCLLWLASCSLSPTTVPNDRAITPTPQASTLPPQQPQKSQQQPQTTTRHPTLLSVPSDLKKYTTRATQQPWSSMVAQALVIAGTPQAAPSQALGAYARALRNDLNAATIAWISAPQDPRWRIARDHALAGLPLLASLAAGNHTWDGEVHVGNTIFTALLALDLMYDDVDPSTRSDAEAAISKTIAGIDGYSWSESAYALRGTWALYLGDHDALEKNKILYRKRWEDMITPDGVFIEGPGYALARMSRNDREQKHLFMDILAINGEDDWYHDPRMVKAYRWLWAYATTVSGNPVTFGDTSPGRADLGSIHNSAALLRTARFDPEAAQWGYRLRAMNSNPPEPQLSVFLLMDPPVSPSSPQKSGIYPNGGAWFTSGSSGMLQSALWNPRQAHWHNHQDVNAVQVSENGTALLRNVGYAGANRGILDRPWSWVNSTAESSNVLIANGPLHAEKIGDGISDGWIDGPCQFATGTSGPSQAQFVHLRTLMQVAHSGSESGYWIVWDKVSGKSGLSVSTPWHPASDQEPTHHEGLNQWTWNITEKRNGAKPQSMTIRLLSEASSITVKKGAQANWGNSYVDTYLFPTYTVNDSGTASFATLVHGGDSALDCTSTTDADGTVRNHISNRQTIHDHWWQPRSSAGKLATYEASWYRERQPDSLSDLIVWNATAWSAGGVTLRSPRPVTLILTDTRIRMSSVDPTEVSLSGISGSLFTTAGQAVDPSSLHIPAGITLFSRSPVKASP